MTKPKKAPHLRGVLNCFYVLYCVLRLLLKLLVLQIALVRCLFFHVFRALDGSADFDQVVDVVHKGKYAHREETDCIECKEWADNVLACVDIFEQTKNAVDSDEKFDERHPRELLCVMALCFLFGSTALRGTDEAALCSKNSGEYGARVAYGDTDTESHQNGEREQTNLPTGVAGATLGDKVKDGRGDCREEDKGKSDCVSPSGEMSDRFKEREQRPGAERGEQHAGVDRVVRCMKDGANLHAERNLGAEHLRQNLDGRLNGAFCPAELLSLERVDVVREFCRDDHIEYKFHLPTG